MVKRRNLTIGLGALVFGSGATTISGAFNSSTTSPSANLNVLSDARLVVQAPGTIPSGTPSGFSSGNDTDATKKGTLDSFTDTAFQRSSLPTAQIDSDDNNDTYKIKAGITTGVSAFFDGIMEIVNDDGQSHTVGINYGDYDTSTDGYGADVDTSDYDDTNSTLGRKDVQQMYQFKVPDDSAYLPSSATNSEKLLSPDPSTDNSDKFNETVTIGAGESAILVLDYDTSGKVGVINNAATGGNPFQGNTYVELLDKIWVEADP